MDVRRSWLAMGFTVAGIGIGASEACWGSGFQLRESSAAALGNAFAGAAVSADAPSVIANNPAAIIGLSGNQASGDLSIVIPSLIFSGSGFTAARQPIGGGDGGDAGGAQPVPAAYGFYDALPDLKFGFAVSVPFGLATQYDNGWVGRYQAIKSRVEAININPVLAYRVSDWLAVGGGPAVQRLDTELSNAINSTAVARSANPALPTGFALPDGFARVTGDALSIGYTLGVLAEISPVIRLGASYRSQISHAIDGTATFDVPAPLSANPRFRSTPATTDLKTPDIVSLAGAYQVSPEVTLLTEIQWTNWGVVKNLRIERPDGTSISDQPEQWHSTWFGSVGATYRPDSRWTFRGGIAFDSTPVRDAFRTARLPDSDRYWLAVGLGYSWTADLRLDAAYVHIFGGTTPINEVSPTGDVLVGHYSDHVDIVSLSATLRF